MVREYGGGTPGRELAERFGLAQSTVIGLLRDRRASLRHPRVSPTDVAQSVERYRQGLRQIDIVTRFGRHKSSAQHTLRRAENYDMGSLRESGPLGVGCTTKPCGSTSRGPLASKRIEITNLLAD